LLIDSGLSDSGYYQCIAKNDVGVVMATARLQIFLQGMIYKTIGVHVHCNSNWKLPKWRYGDTVTLSNFYFKFT